MERRTQRRPVSDVQADPGRGPAVLQRGARLLRAESLRRRQPRSGGPSDVQLSARRRPGDHQVRHGDPAGAADLRGPADPRHPSQPVVPRVHPAQDQRSGAEDPRVHPALPRPTGRR